MSGDYNEDRAHEMGFGDDENAVSREEFMNILRGVPMGKIILHQFQEFERQEPLREEDLLRSQNFYQGLSAHDMMDRTRNHFRPAIMPKWFLITGLLLLAAATGMFVEIMRGLR